jgi:hypothetical protein
VGRIPTIRETTTHALNEGTDPSEEELPEKSDAHPQETMIVDTDATMGADENIRDPTTTPEITDILIEMHTDDVNMCTNTEGQGSLDGKHGNGTVWGDGMTQQRVAAVNTEPSSDSPKPTKKLRTDKDRGVPRDRTRSKTSHSQTPRM